MKIIFMGTPDFAVPTLKALIDSRHEVTAVYTKPDQEAGRGRKLVFSPVKEAALQAGIPVYQPEKLGKSAVEEMRSIPADVIVVAAYGKILRPSVLYMKRFGCMNVHASLLPKYRGAAPIQWAVLNGETESGVTIMQMNEGLDTGDILYQEKLLLSEDETSGSLFEKLSLLGGPSILKVLDLAEAGLLNPMPQGETTTEYARMLVKEDGVLDFQKSAVENERFIRGMYPWPSAQAEFRGRSVRIYAAKALPDDSDALPGTVSKVTKHGFTIRCGEGALNILSLQPEGKKEMSADAFLRGYRVVPGESFQKA
ncbi:MAG: methionyl-tRNA formyltransferase [Lachnospiraceae bacterium]|nr:methionyl-tRNA formyltransferase [Lachnospiraceae bacterium]